MSELGGGSLLCPFQKSEYAPDREIARVLVLNDSGGLNFVRSGDVKSFESKTVLSDGSGEEMYQLIAELYPICRSITGQGIRETFGRIQQHIPLTITEVPSGTQVFDWMVPLEWNIRDAYVADRQGIRIIDFKQSNLHVVSYSTPISARMSLRELKEHLFTLPDHPDWIPYRTSYYKESWGFCLSHRQYLELLDEDYDVVIDSSLEKGHLTYGEYYLPGETADEVLISCHACHPSLCNDNLSGIAVATFLAKSLQARSRRYSYRFLFLPVTIGAITWLALNQRHVSNIKHGFVLTGVGDEGGFTYKKTRDGAADIDAAFAHVLRHSGELFEVTEFIPYGYDERQYGSPGFNLPVGCFMRRANGRYPEYHTSADNLDFVKPTSLSRSLEVVRSVVEVLEANRGYVNTSPFCEPQLGKRGLYRAIGGNVTGRSAEMAFLWVLNLSDGSHTLLQIAERSGLPFSTIKLAADELEGQGLLRRSG